ncbi:calcium-dependent protein kinase SK5-like [Trifolium pratense]|uniref:calcium-dependent protein kinase SK5-like n=1 Tax=Trifolium pratense TaxID=57577 RepID=UPI001E697974|nr:calcium-dependent protein kinase SK5-like [Trifolium pratense]
MSISKTTTQPKPTQVLPYATEDLLEIYTLGRKLGEGQFATTYLCTHNTTGRTYACKSNPKKNLLCKGVDYDDVLREIQIMQHLSQHPKVVKIHDTYEDSCYVDLVMEFCEGGNLYDRIKQKGHYSEQQAAKLVKNIVEAVQDCHSLGVMHRDLKPENLVFDTVEDDANLKIIDFGSSVFYKSGETCSAIVGTPDYMAPEVLLEHYGPEADLWSVGVILYILLSGVPPFWAETEEGTFIQILQGILDFQSEPWPTISDSAKDLIQKMLDMNPKKRFTAQQVLCHPWIVDNNIAPNKQGRAGVQTSWAMIQDLNIFRASKICNFIKSIIQTIC